MNVDSIEQRPGNLTHVTFDLRHGALALSSRVPAVAAWAWVWS